MLFLTCTEHTSTMSPELVKLRIMTICIKLKVLLKVGASEMICVELRAKKYKMCTVYREHNYAYVECSCSHALQPRRQSVKLRIMTISIKTKVLNKFGASEMKCVELRAKKL